MPRIILHIGTHKTATTSIQNFLFQNRTELASRGVFYPDYSLVGRAPHYAHLGMVNALSGRHRSYRPADARKFFAAVRDRSADFDTTIISAEPFYRHVQNDPSDNPYYEPEEYWPLRQAYVEGIRDIFGDAEIVVVFRRQAEYAQSLYQEHVKVTRYNGNFRKFLGDFWYHFEFLRQAQTWNRVFPNLKVFSFDRLLQTGDAVGEFCRIMQIPVENLVQPPRANEGLPVDLVVLKRMLHRTARDKDQLRANIETLQGMLSPQTHALFKTRSFFSSQRHLLDFQSAFDADNTGLLPLLAHDDIADGSIFRDGTKSGVNYGDQLKPQFLLNMLDLGLDLPAAVKAE